MPDLVLAENCQSAGKTARSRRKPQVFAENRTLLCPKRPYTQKIAVKYSNYNVNLPKIWYNYKSNLKIRLLEMP